MAGTLETLLHFDGTNGSQTFTDATGKHTWVSYGFLAGPNNDTSQAKFGTASLGMLSTGGESVVCTEGIPWGTGPFTIDFWMKLNSAPTGQANIFDVNNPGGIIFMAGPGTPLSFYNGGVVITGTTAVTVNVWHHIALTFDGAKTYLFLDGNLEGTPWANAAPGYSSPANNPQLRQVGITDPLCWLDEFRILLGNCDWTANFTPPTAPYAAGNAYTLSANTGTFTMTGVAAGTLYGRVLQETTVGTFTTTGINANLVYTSFTNYVLVCGTGQFNFIGYPVGSPGQGLGISGGLGMPVVTVLSGGIPVVDVSSLGPNMGAPVSEAAPGRGIPVTKVSKFGTPVVYI